MTVQEVQFLLTVRIESLDTHGHLTLAPVEDPSPVHQSDTDVLEGSGRHVRPHLEAFFGEAAARGWQVERPRGRRQDYRNVFPRSGRRVAAVNVASGWTGIRGLLTDDEPLADAYLHNGVRIGTKIYLVSEPAVAAAVRLCERALAERS